MTIQRPDYLVSIIRMLVLTVLPGTSQMATLVGLSAQTMLPEGHRCCRLGFRVWPSNAGLVSPSAMSAIAMCECRGTVAATRDGLIATSRAVADADTTPVEEASHRRHATRGYDLGDTAGRNTARQHQNDAPDVTTDTTDVDGIHRRVALAEAAAKRLR